MAGQSGSWHAVLVGGPMDGDTVVLVPNGSVSPPDGLGYMHPDGWLWYESMPDKNLWPDEDAKKEYHYYGHVAWPLALAGGDAA